jgi:hypothetical protein
VRISALRLRYVQMGFLPLEAKVFFPAILHVAKEKRAFLPAQTGIFFPSGEGQ